MKKTILSILLAMPILADTNTIPTLTIGHRTFTNATIRKVNPLTVIVRDEGGFGSMAITNLPEPLRSQFWDENEVRRLQERSSRVAAQAEQQRRENAIARAASIHRKDEADKRDAITVRVDKVLAGGFLGTVIVEHDIREAPRLTGNQRIGAYIGYTPRGRLIRVEKEDKQAVFIVNGPADATEGKELGVVGWKIGPKQIEGKTVEEWNCKPSWQR